MNLAKRYVSDRGIDLLKELQIRNISAVSKPQGKDPEMFHQAVWMADRLCSFALKGQLSKSISPIVVADMTDLIRRTVQQFDGIAFDMDQ